MSEAKDTYFPPAQGDTHTGSHATGIPDPCSNTQHNGLQLGEYDSLLPAQQHQHQQQGPAGGGPASKGQAIQRKDAAILPWAKVAALLMLFGGIVVSYIPFCILHSAFCILHTSSLTLLLLLHACTVAHVLVLCCMLTREQLPPRIQPHAVHIEMQSIHPARLQMCEHPVSTAIIDGQTNHLIACITNT